MARNPIPGPSTLEATAAGPVATEASNPHAGTPAIQPLMRAGMQGGTPGMPMGHMNADSQIGGGYGVAGSAVAKNPARPDVPYNRFRIMNSGYFMNGGVRTALRAGKIIDDRNYDIKRVKGQGFKLEPYTEDSDEFEQATVVDPLPPQAAR